MQKEEIPVVGFPLKGVWSVMNPPGHNPAAFDFLAVDMKRMPYKRLHFLLHLFFRISVTDTYAWSQPVHAPFDGVVVASSDGSPDRINISFIKDILKFTFFRPKIINNDFRPFGGNYVILRSESAIALFAHLKRNSISVSEGDRVAAGQKIGKIGNSGASIQPHLHFQLISGTDPFEALNAKKETLFRFRNFKQWNGGSWDDIRESLPDKKRIIMG